VLALSGHALVNSPQPPRFPSTALSDFSMHRLDNHNSALYALMTSICHQKHALNGGDYMGHAKATAERVTAQANTEFHGQLRGVFCFVCFAGPHVDFAKHPGHWKYRFPLQRVSHGRFLDFELARKAQGVSMHGRKCPLTWNAGTRPYGLGASR
jgi:hypothetical protein